MKQYSFHHQELVAVWRGRFIEVSSESSEEAEAFIRDNGLGNSADWIGDNFGGRVKLLSTDGYLAFQEPVSVEQNDDIPTIVIQDKQNRNIADNCGNRHYLAESGLWRERAIGLIKDKFDVPDERIAEFVDEFWANDTTDEENLFGFDLWFHGADPYIKSKKRELYAFVYPFEMGLDATDGEIVAAYGSEENKEREWSIEKLTIEELACKINNDQIFAEQHVRFIRL